MTSIDTVLLDLDGTLVDSNYHHVVAWARAFAASDVHVDLWRVHRAIGMGGDKLVGAVAGDDAEEQHGDAIRDRWEKEFDQLLDEVPTIQGAAALVRELQGRDLKVVIATSGKPQHTERFLAKLGLDASGLAVTTSEDAEETKPDPDLLRVALDQVDGDRGVLVGDTVWDVEAAERAGLPCVAVLSGGFGEDELRSAGAVAVYRSAQDLLDHLAEALVALPG